VVSTNLTTIGINVLLEIFVLGKNCFADDVVEENGFEINIAIG